MALNGASAALALSDIPWNGPIGAARVAYSNSFTNGTSGFVLNPTRKELRTISEQSGTSLNMLVSGDKNGLVVMLEADAGNLDRSLFFDAIKVYAVSKAASLPDGSFPWIPYPKLIIIGKFSLIVFIDPGMVDFKCSVFISSKFFKFSDDEILRRTKVLPS